MTDEPQALTSARVVPGSMGPGALALTMGISMSPIDRHPGPYSPGDLIATATMPVAGNTQPQGILHGGASAALAETVGSIAAQILVPDRVAVGTELNISHHQPASQGSITAFAYLAHRGRSSCVIEITLVLDALQDGENNPREERHNSRIASARLTCAFLKSR